LRAAGLDSPRAKITPATEIRLMKFIIRIEKWLFYLFVFLLPLQLRIILYSFRPQFNEWTSAYLYGTDILIFLILFLWLARKIKERGWKIVVLQNIWVEVGLFLFLLVSGVSLVLSNNFWLSFYSWAKLLEFGLLFLYIKYNFGRLFSLQRFWQIFVASAAVQSAIAIYQFFAQKSLGLKIFAESLLSPDISGVAKILVDGKKIVRAYGLVPHPNILAAILMLAIFGLAYLFIKNYEKLNISKKAAFGLVFVLLSGILFFTFSRVVTLIGLGFFIVWLLVIYWRQAESRRPVIFTLILLFLIGFLLSAAYFPYISARYDVAALGKSQAVSLRVFYDQVAWQLFKGSPLLGIGQGNFVWTFIRPAVFENWVYQPVHNIYLLIAAEIGILGLFAFLWFLFKIMRSIYMERKAIKDRLALYCLLGIFVFFLAIGFFDHFLWDLQQGQLMFWIVLGIIAGLGPYSSTDRARPSEG
jgi:O-antigen ligase